MQKLWSNNRVGSRNLITASSRRNDMKKLIGTVIISSAIAVAAVVGTGLWSQFGSATASISAPENEGFYILPTGNVRRVETVNDVVDAPAGDGFDILPMP